MEDHQRSAFAARGLDVDQLAGLIGEGAVGEPFADVGARGVVHFFCGARADLIDRVVHATIPSLLEGDPEELRRDVVEDAALQVFRCPSPAAIWTFSTPTCSSTIAGAVASNWKQA